MNTQLTTKALNKELGARLNQFKSMLPAHVTPEKFLRTVSNAAESNPDILECDVDSVLLSCKKAAKDGLLLDGKEAAIIKFKTKNKKTNSWESKAQYMPMIDGILKLARQSGQIEKINAICVYSADPFSYNPGADDLPDHNPDWFGDRGSFVGVYAFAKLKTGGYVVEIMAKREVEEVRKVSKSGSDQNGNPAGIWYKWYDRKAQVACLKRLCKRLPSSTDMELLEQAIKHDNEEFETAPEKDITPAGDQSHVHEAYVEPGSEAGPAVEEELMGELAGNVDTSTGEIINQEIPEDPAYSEDIPI